MKTLLVLWQIGIVYVYDLMVVDHILSIFNFVNFVILLGVTVWFAVVLHSYGPPPAGDMEYSGMLM